MRPARWLRRALAGAALVGAALTWAAGCSHDTPYERRRERIEDQREHMEDIREDRRDLGLPPPRRRR